MPKKFWSKYFILPFELAAHLTQVGSMCHLITSQKHNKNESIIRVKSNLQHYFPKANSKEVSRITKFSKPKEAIAPDLISITIVKLNAKLLVLT